MSSRVSVDDVLLAEARRIGHHRTQKETVKAALTEYIAKQKRLELVSLFGTIEYDSDNTRDANEMAADERA
jgi:Arc/MetJ family transcription regulator